MTFPTKTLRYALSSGIVTLFSATVLAEEPPQLPDAGKKLKQAYRQSVEAAVKPIRSRFLADLKKLLEQSMKGGKLTEALALKQEIDSFAASHLIGEWNAEFGRYYIGEDRTVRSTGGNSGTWEVQDGDLVLNWQKGGSHRYSLSEGGDTIRGKHITTDGKSKPISSTRTP